MGPIGIPPGSPTATMTMDRVGRKTKIVDQTRDGQYEKHQLSKGVAAMIEVARALAKSKCELKYSIIFVAFDKEEVAMILT